MWPTLQALKALGNSGSIQEINDKAIEFAGLSEEQLEVPHKEGPQTEVGYRLHWARTYLKFGGAVTNTSRGVWAITEHGQTFGETDIATIVARRQAMSRDQKANTPSAGSQLPNNDVELESSQLETGIEPGNSTFSSTQIEAWTEFLLKALLEMSPTEFEKLCQRVLRESGFTRVEVTGKTGDGGIDGIGVLRVSLLSFHVFFQCKRYRGSVGAAAIRDFRGAMVGRTDKGLFITTGTFTPDAKKEATRDGAPVLDLIDGEDFCVILKNLKLGVATELVEQVTVDADWFSSL